MSKKNFLERMAKHAFVFAAVLAASVALSSCSKDDDNTKKEETVEVQPNSAVIDGKLWKLTNPEYYFFDGNNNTSYALLLYIGNTRSYISIDGDGGKYNGKTIDLTKTEEEFADRAYNWKVVCVDPGSNNRFFAGCALEKMFEGGDYVDYVRFSSGTMRINFNESTNEFDVVIENAKIKDELNGDKKEHTLNLKWKGVAKRKDS